MRPARWVVFDFGQVIARPTKALPRLARLLDVDENDFQAAYVAHRDAYDENSDARAYWTAVAWDCGLRGPDDALIASLVECDNEGWNDTDPATLRLVDELHGAGVRLAILSNASAQMGALIRRQPWAPRFEHIIISGEHGLLKPGAAIYRLLLARLRVDAGDVVFVDDRQDNVVGACACAIDAIRFTGAEALRGELAARGVMG